MLYLAPFLANFARKNNIRLIGNIIHSCSVGHVICELDNFLRMRYLGEVEDRYAYVAHLFESNLVGHMVRLYPQLFCTPAGINPNNERIQIFCSNTDAHIAIDAHFFYPELFVDAGISGLKSVLPDGPTRHRSWPTVASLATSTGDIALPCWMLSNADAQAEALKYQFRRASTPDYQPLRDIGGLTPDLVELLGGECHKLALIHIRYGRDETNAGTATNPENLLPTLEYLIDCGYKVVKVGTEAFPGEFNRYPIINYSESRIRNFGNDLLLLKAASLSIMNASGIEHISELFGTPMVSYGRWNVSLLPAAENCVIVPSLFRRRDNGTLLKLSEQMNYWKTRPEGTEPGSGDNFPSHSFDERPPTSVEILRGTQEAIDLGYSKRQRSELQERIFSLDHDNYKYCKSRISQYFLETLPDELQE